MTTLRKKNAPNLAKFCFIRYWRPMAYTRTNRVRPVAIGFMTDTMGRMHSDAQFAGSSSVPAHVEMMGFLGIGNNPMVGCTVACAVDVATALNK